MLWLSAVLIAAVSNLDNLAAGFAFGMRDARIALAPNAVIAGVTMAGTAGAMGFGRALSRLMSPAVGSAVGSVIILAIGAGTVLASLRELRAPAIAPRLRAPGRSPGKVVSLREALVLGVALSLNNVGSGVGAGIAEISPLATTLLAGAVSLICVGGGSRVGWWLGRLVVGCRASLVAGLVLVGVGAATLMGVG